MRRVMACLVLALTVGSAAVAKAGCCSSEKGKDKGKDEMSKSCGDMYAKLNLTDEQKAKIADIEKSCAKACKETCEKSQGEIEKLLTPEQAKEWESLCKDKGHSCHHRCHHRGDDGDDDKGDKDSKTDT